MASLLTQLTSPALPFLCTPEVEATFTELKRHFTTAPILVQAYPSRQFIVKVDASDSSMGQSSTNILSLTKLHPGAIFSRCLMPAEHNYDPGNHELLAIKLALEELRHWLEGAEHLFIV